LWSAELPPHLHGETDTNERPHRSRLRLFENGRELGPRHSPHSSIELLGQGRYSFWHEGLYFSTSDRSDPNSNNYAYTVASGPIAPDSMLETLSESRAPIEAWEAPQPSLRCAVFGMGNRGLYLAQLAKSYAGIEVGWVVDLSESRLAEALVRIGGDGVRTAATWAAALEDPAIDIVFVALPDYLHRSAAEAAFEAGKNVYLEKPLATTSADARAVARAWQRSGLILQLGYVLRHAPFYRAIRKVVRSGTLGPVRMVIASEQLDVMHGASFLRRWHAQSAYSGGLIVHKSCHDLDLICWLLDTRPRRVTSFGGVDTFARPAPAPFCSQCGERASCPYVDDGLHEARTAAERREPTAHGLDRCVFRADQDIVDNQLVSFELASGSRGTFHLTVQGRRTERRITIIGDAARLDGVFEDSRFTVTFSNWHRDPVEWSADGADAGTHGGGDSRMMRQFLNACAGREPPASYSAEEALAGVVFATAAEEARQSGRVVELDDRDFTAL
jgi:predicted dehydrogenase